MRSTPPGRVLGSRCRVGTIQCDDLGNDGGVDVSTSALADGPDDGRSAPAASCAARVPTPPSTPCTRTVPPRTGPSPKTARWAVMPGIPRHAPTSSPTVSGSATACGRDNGVLGRGAERAVGLRTVHPDPFADAGGVDPRPTLSITPAPSLCGITRGIGHRRPEPAATLLGVAGVDPGRGTRTRTSPAPGSGAGRSPNCSTWRPGLAVVPDASTGVLSLVRHGCDMTRAARSGVLFGIDFRSEHSWSQARSARLVARATRSMPRR